MAIWSGAELRRLFAEGRRELTEAAYGRITPEFTIELFECQACGFQFFDPTLAGTGEFYAQLERTPYYPEMRPEFTLALELCHREKVHRLLDVGAGDGAFLDQARSVGATTFGIELNTRAAAAAAARGHTILARLLGEFSDVELGGPVDFVSFFHVVEHVPNPREVLREAMQLARPGGYIMLSVPSRDGVFRLLPHDPANLPPHHISRWREIDLRRLGESCGLRVVDSGTEVLFGGDIEKFWLQHNRFAAAIGRAPWPGGTWLPKVISFLYRKLGCRYYLPRWGASVYAILQRP